MKKTAIFVEGQTEAIFIKSLVFAWARQKDVEIVREQLHGGIFSTVEAHSEANASYFFLIVDCGNDDAVLSALKDRYASLVIAGFSNIWGVRDLYPLASNQLAPLQQAINGLLPAGAASSRMFIAVREVESWFLAEDEHFAAIHPQLTRQQISNSVQYDILNDDPEAVPHPSDLLKRIYNIVGLTYRKKRKQVERTVNAMDLERLYCDCDGRVPSFVLLRDALDGIV